MTKRKQREDALQAEHQAETKASEFTKDQILASKKYKPYRDCLRALLNEKRTYTIEEVECVLNEYLQRKVN